VEQFSSTEDGDSMFLRDIKTLNHYMMQKPKRTWGYCSPFMDRGRLRALSKNPLITELQNYSTGAEIS
jgi:hypothetical protein